MSLLAVVCFLSWSARDPVDEAPPLLFFSTAATSRCNVASLAAPSTSTTPIPGTSTFIDMGFLSNKYYLYIRIFMEIKTNGKSYQ